MFNGLIISSDSKIPFTQPISDKVVVEPIAIRNHPAYNRTGSHRLVATAFIERYEWLGFYGGQVLHSDTSWNPYQIAPVTNASYIIDAENIGNEMRYINDYRGGVAKEPNVGFFRSDEKIGGKYYTSVVVTLKDIQPGEEIVASYGNEYWESLKNWYNEKNPFICDECDYRTTTQHNLYNHISRNHGVKIFYDCEMCNAQYTTNQGLMDHVNYIHTKEVLYVCEECNFSDYSRQKVYNHNLKEHNLDKYKCPDCEYKTYKVSSFKRHIQSVHEKKKKFKCHYCDFKAAYKQSIQRHVDTKHLKKKPYRCSECDFITAHSHSLKNHKELHFR